MASNSTPHHSGDSSLNFKDNNHGVMIIPPKDLNIVWGNDTRYWSISDKKEIPTELYQVSWLEVTGVVDEAKSKKGYEVGFKVSLNPDAFGWGKYPVYIMVKRGREGKVAWTKNNINPNKKGLFEIKGSSNQIQDVNDNKLYFGLYEVWSGKWKGGLKIYNAYIKEF